MHSIRAKPEGPGSTPFPDHNLVFDVVADDNFSVVLATGEFDLASHDPLVAASTAGRHPAMVIDLADVTFMDCGGYRSLVAARLIIEQGGRTLAIRGATGQPARLLHLIARLERGCGPEPAMSAVV
jgi:anti-anti-sigma factor